jgi:hypothetical protein
MNPSSDHGVVPMPWYALVDDPQLATMLAFSEQATVESTPASAPCLVVFDLLDHVRAGDAEVAMERRRALVDEIFQMVAPEGEAWFAMRNRFSALHFLGVRAPDNWPFEPLFAVPLQRLIRSTLRKRSTDRRFPMCRRDLTDLLVSGGFADICFLPAFIEIRDPDFVVAGAGRGALRAYLRTVRYTRAPRGRIAINALCVLDVLGASSALAPGFVVTARRPSL